ncbi:MAG: radical SAM protein [Algoriphagus sp.]|uniref:radical SAM/SPASM domain-containing protein n=1 Tax=Algoriphagus sp. TaxID=1872435 RepID=UPI0027355124|nr:radical SAM protein [Algoriphagus sp.]MDP3200457.1 radical SAM protein [Algoriphagus sp.]
MENNLLKYSKYNSIISLGDKLSVLYNSKEDKSLIFRKEKEHLFSLLPEKLKNLDLGIFENLKNIGAIVSEDRDELQEVIQKSKEIDNADDSYRLIINPTMNCNFKCWYCYESHIENSKLSNPTIQKICNLIDNILLSNKNLKTFDLSFFGGEPLMYYSSTSVPLIDYYRTKYLTHKDIDFTISFTSNGYLLNDKILGHLLKGNESKHFQITLDGGREEHNKVRVAKRKGGSYDKILSAVKTLIENDIEVILRVNYTSETLASTYEILNDISGFPEESRKNLKISYHRVWQDNGNNLKTEQTSKQIISDFKKANFAVSDNELLDNLNNPCYADKKNEAVINYNGDVFKCTARDFSETNKYGEILEDGSINWNEKIETWENIKIQSKACQNCRILPICGGGCHQINLEAKGMDICQMGFDNEKKDEIILNRISHIFDFVNEQQ